MDSDTGAYPAPPEWGGTHLASVITLHGLLLLIAAAVGAAIAYYVIKSGEEARLAEIREGIFKAVRDSLDKALHARGPQMVMAAEALIQTANKHLSPFMGPGRSILAPLDAMSRALTGKTPDTGPQPAATVVATAAPAATAATQPGSATPAASNATAVVVTPAVITNFNIVGGGGANCKPTVAPAPPAAPPQKLPDRDMTIPEQEKALQAALDAFNKSWTKHNVLPFLKAAQEALLKPRSPEPKKKDEGHH